MPYWLYWPCSWLTEPCIPCVDGLTQQQQQPRVHQHWAVIVSLNRWARLSLSLSSLCLSVSLPLSLNRRGDAGFGRRSAIIEKQRRKKKTTHRDFHTPSHISPGRGLTAPLRGKHGGDGRASFYYLLGRKPAHWRLTDASACPRVPNELLYYFDSTKEIIIGQNNVVARAGGGKKQRKQCSPTPPPLFRVQPRWEDWSLDCIFFLPPSALTIAGENWVVFPRFSPLSSGEGEADTHPNVWKLQTCENGRVVPRAQTLSLST